MSKISLLPPAVDPTGDETVVLVQDGETRRSALGPLVDAKVTPAIAAAAESLTTSLTALVGAATMAEAGATGAAASAALNATSALGSLNAILAALAGYAMGAVVPAYIATIPLLRAIAGPIAGQTVILSDPTRFGLFEFVGGDQSAQIAAEGYKAIWVAPSGQTGSTGAWRRIIGTSYADIRWWGAVPNSTAEAAGNVLRFNAAAKWCGIYQKTLWVPIGDWYVTGQNSINDGIVFEAPDNGSLSVQGECRQRSRIIRAPIAPGVYPPPTSVMAWNKSNTGARYYFRTLHFDGNQQNFPVTLMSAPDHYQAYAADGVTRSFAYPSAAFLGVFLVTGGVRRTARLTDYHVTGSGVSRVVWFKVAPPVGTTVEIYNYWYYEQASTMRHMTGTGTMGGVFISECNFSNRVGDGYLAATQWDVAHFSDIYVPEGSPCRPRACFSWSRLPLELKMDKATVTAIECEPGGVRPNVVMQISDTTARAVLDLAGDVAAGSTSYTIIDLTNVKCQGRTDLHPLRYNNSYNHGGTATGCDFAAMERIQRPRGLTFTDCRFAISSTNFMSTLADPVEIWLDSDNSEVTLIRPYFWVNRDIDPDIVEGAVIDSSVAVPTTAINRRIRVIDPRSDGSFTRGLLLSRCGDVDVRIGRGFRCLQNALQMENTSGFSMRTFVEVGPGFESGSLLGFGGSTPSSAALGDMTIELAGRIDSKRSALFQVNGNAGWTINTLYPPAGSTVTLNGHVITFVDDVPVGQQVRRMGDGSGTGQALVDYINRNSATGLYANTDNLFLRVRSRATDTDIAMAESGTGWTVPATLTSPDTVSFAPDPTGIDWRGRIDLIVDADPNATHRALPGAVARRAQPHAGQVDAWHYRAPPGAPTQFGSKALWAAAPAI